jgi:hypothetical protein
MLMLLDLTERQPAALARLGVRMAAEARRPPQPHLLRPGPRRVLALAALLLITLGLGWMLAPDLRPPTEAAGGPVVALLVPEGLGTKAFPAMVEAAKGGPILDKASPQVEVLQVDLVALRRELDAGRTPPPPQMELTLRLHNRGPREVVLDLAVGRYEFRIDLEGPGTERRLAPAEAPRPFKAPGVIRLPPGASYSVALRRLSEVAAGRVWYIYPTKAGHYTLAVRLRVAVQSPPGEWTITTPPRTIDVQNVP